MNSWARPIGLTSLVLVVLTCSTENPPPSTFQPPHFCPGQAACLDEGDGILLVGAGSAVITSAVGEFLSLDVNNNAEFDPLDGDEFEDKNQNGQFDGEWIAGFGNGRAAAGVADQQWARAIALRQNQTTIVLVALDVVGYFFDEIELIREAVSDLEIDHLSISATHTHEARDTVGIWGLTEDITGINPDYMNYVRSQTEKAVREAIANLTQSKLRYTTVNTRDLPGGMIQYQSDSRDPQIIDDEIRVIHFLTPDNRSIAHLINWGSHPEYMGDENSLLSSDFPHWLRQGIENGVTGPDGKFTPGLNGMAAFFNGALGSQIGPGRVKLKTFDGTNVPKYSPNASETLGKQLAYYILKNLADSEKTITDDTAHIGFARESFFVDIQNRAYHTALLKKLFDRGTYNWDDELTLQPGENEPDIKSEVAIIDIGRAQIISVPGELDPALFVGGYDGSFTPKDTAIVNTSTRVKNPPDISQAPAGPYLRDLARESAEYVMLFGLTGDMLGYFVPEFDYKLHPYNPYFDEAEGDHYEETNSVGIDGWPNIETKLTALLKWRRLNTRK